MQHGTYAQRRPLADGFVYSYIDAFGRPQTYDLRIGRTFTAELFPGHPVTFYVTLIRGEEARVADYEGGSGTAVPVDSVRHMERDLAGRVDGPPGAPHPAIRAVLEGKAQWLGKGDDGIAFRAGDKVVKVSTTVPYQPMNPFHRTPEQAADMLQAQAIVAEDMRKAGVPGIPPAECYRHGDKAFIVRDYVEVPPRLTQAQCDEAQDIILAMHERGWALRDTVQVGLLDGRVVMFDTGKARRFPSDDKRTRKYWRQDDLGYVTRFYGDNGAEYTFRGELDVEEEWQEATGVIAINRAAFLGPKRVAELRDRIGKAYAAMQAKIREDYGDIYGGGTDPAIDMERDAALAQLDEAVQRHVK